jgi:hypothetical protein
MIHEVIKIIMLYFIYIFDIVFNEHFSIYNDFLKHNNYLLLIE